MRRVGILTTWFCLSSSVAWGALYNNDVPECAALGYDMSLSECQSQMRSLLGNDEAKKYNPLHCPYDYNKVKCWKNNCGGYTIAEPNANFESEECLLGIDGGKVQKMYRYKSCMGKDGVNYRYNNGDCIDRCNLNDYPYDTPPGSLYGKVESCYDDAMHYGYSACNEGFGKLVNGEYVPNNGRCDMLICDINEYPYWSIPDEKRGKVTFCAGGTNKYYRYESCNDGYFLTKGMCRRNFDVTASNFDDAVWGDVLTYKGTQIGTIVHLPDAEDNRYIAIATTWYNGKWGRFLGKNNDLVQDIKGKCYTKLYYDDYVNNGQSHYVVRKVYEYYPSVCGKDNEYCGAGKWYIPATKEVQYLFDVEVAYRKELLRLSPGDRTGYTYCSNPLKDGVWLYWDVYNRYGDCDWCPAVMFLEFGSNKLTCE